MTYNITTVTINKLYVAFTKPGLQWAATGSEAVCVRCICIQTTLGTTYKCFSFILVIADIPTLFNSILLQTCQAYHMSAVQYVTNQYADLTSW